MFFVKTAAAKRGTNCQACFRALAHTARSTAASTGRAAGDTIQALAVRVGHEVRRTSQRVYAARAWTAPRLDDAARQVTTTIAPRISSALRSTAGRVNPDKRGHQRRRPASALAWSVGTAAILAAAGGAAMAIRHRFRAATPAESEAARDREAARARPPAPTVPAQGTSEEGASSADTSASK